MGVFVYMNRAGMLSRRIIWSVPFPEINERACAVNDEMIRAVSKYIPASRPNTQVLVTPSAQHQVLVHASRCYLKTASTEAEIMRRVRQGPLDNPTKLAHFGLSSDGKLVKTAAPVAPQAPLHAPQSLLQRTKHAVVKYPVKLVTMLISYMLPHGYPSTVASSYAPYAAWTAAGMMFSSIAGVLSTQSLLYAIGVGAGAVPLAAALNWVIKDGLGQLGGVLYAALINNKFDADPKMWRYLSALAQDASTFLEVCTPLLPGAFLPVAAIANVGKNISWISASATRAGLHQVLAVRGNLADVTGKAGSQTIAASTAGTILGVALSPVIGSQPSHILIAFAICSVCHLTCIYHGLQRISLPTLNEQRLEIAVSAYLDLFSAPTPAVPAEQEMMPLNASDPVSSNESQLLHSELRALGPLETAKRERFVPWSTWWHRQRQSGAQILVGTSLEKLAGFGAFYAASRTPNSKYVLAVERGWRPKLHLLFTHEAAWRDVISGYLHAIYVRRQMATGAAESDVEVVERGALFVHEYGDLCLDSLERAGWWVGQPLLEHDVTKRFTVEGTRSTAESAV